LLQPALAEVSADWWPAQKAAQAYVEVAVPHSFAERNLLQGLAGLAARAVNEGRGDELVWMDDGNTEIQEWQQLTVKRLSMERRGGFSVWELLTRYQEKSLVKGYVVYQAEVEVAAVMNRALAGAGRPRPVEAGKGRRTTGGDRRLQVPNPEMSPDEVTHRTAVQVGESLNVATTLAGLLDAVPVEESLEGRIQACGLSRLADGRSLTLAEAFERYRGQCDSNVVYLLNPRLPNMRDMAVAHRGFAGYGTNGTTRMLFDWTVPLAPVIGWGQGDEFKHTAPVSRSAHFHTVSDCVQNIPLLSADAGRYQSRRLPEFDPKTIDRADKRPCVAFMMSDGDNLGYMMAGFWSKSFWGHPAHGQFPMGFSACLGDLAQTMPVVLDRIVETKPPRTSVIQFTGGYFYPDLFAADRTNRWDLLRAHARRINAQMQRTGATIMCCIMDKSDSPEAQQALRIFAEEINPLLGIMIMEYAPYHGGGGKVHWVSDGRGGEVPAVTARYCMWAGMNKKGAGGPAEVARQANEDAATNGVAGVSWVAVHAWSQHADPVTGRKESGLGPVARCVELLDQSKVRVVSPEEMLWRLRRGRCEPTRP
jgi:hypothetical protein